MFELVCVCERVSWLNLQSHVVVVPLGVWWEGEGGGGGAGEGGRSEERRGGEGVISVNSPRVPCRHKLHLDHEKRIGLVTTELGSAASEYQSDRASH